MAKTPILTKDGLVRYDENIKEYIDTGLKNKVSKTDIVNNLVSTDVDAPLSAMQGKVLKELIDNIESGGGGTTYELSRTDDIIKLTGKDGSSSEVDITPIENLLVYPYLISDVTKDNYTIVDNGDGTLSISCNIPEGTIMSEIIVNRQPLPAGTYVISGCPEEFTETGVHAQIYIKDNDASNTILYNGKIFNGQNMTFTITEVGYLSLFLNFGGYGHTGISLTNSIFKPMLEIGMITHSYKPYKYISDKVSKSGDTMTGDLTVKANVNIPLLADNTGDTLLPVPVAGAIQGSSSQYLSDILPSTKSFIGSIYANSKWYNVISSRHRNGVSDGTKYGMALYSSLTPVSDLCWAQQTNTDTWGATKTILDNSNYSAQIPAATQSAVGLMSAADKKKLDGIATGANAYSLPTASSSTLGGVKTTSTVTSTSGLTACPIISGVPYYKDTNTTYSAATTSANGLMTAAMVTKLNGIATGANKITVDGSMSTTSTNPVQNKVVNSALGGKLSLSGGDMTGSICFADGKGIVDYAKQATVFTTSGTTVTPTSVISAKRPIYVGAVNTSYVTYIRGTYVYLDSTYNPVSSKAWLTNSDQRIKTNSILLNNEDKYLTFFDNLKPRNYNYIRDEEDANKTIGFYAQEVEDALLSAGLTNKDFAGLTIIEDFEEGLGQGKDEAVYYKQFYTLSYEQFIPIIINKVQHMEKEFNEKIKTLEEKIEKLAGGTE